MQTQQIVTDCRMESQNLTESFGSAIVMAENLSINSVQSMLFPDHTTLGLNFPEADEDQDDMPVSQAQEVEMSITLQLGSKRTPSVSDDQGNRVAPVAKRTKLKTGDGARRPLEPLSQSRSSRLMRPSAKARANNLMD